MQVGRKEPYRDELKVELVKMSGKGFNPKRQSLYLKDNRKYQLILQTTNLLIVNIFLICKFVSLANLIFSSFVWFWENFLKNVKKRK